ncbi:10585_t:CDS:1, partial [Gigaspora rosea]
PRESYTQLKEAGKNKDSLISITSASVEETSGKETQEESNNIEFKNERNLWATDIERNNPQIEIVDTSSDKTKNKNNN